MNWHPSQDTVIRWPEKVALGWLGWRTTLCIRLETLFFQHWSRCSNFSFVNHVDHLT
jgi:hypothetical protein